MASGCPIVSTIPLGYKGMVVKPGNVRGMTKAINYFVKNPKLTIETGKKNIELSKKYNWKSFTDNLIKLYGDVIKNH